MPSASPGQKQREQTDIRFTEVRAEKRTTWYCWNQKKLKKGTYYQYYVVAYKEANGTKTSLSASRTIYVPTLGGSYTDFKGVKTIQVRHRRT